MGGKKKKGKKKGKKSAAAPVHTYTQARAAAACNTSGDTTAITDIAVLYHYHLTGAS